MKSRTAARRPPERTTCRAASACAPRCARCSTAGAERHRAAEANWLHNSKAFGTALNGVNIQQAGTRNAAEVKLGVDARLNANVNLWGGVAQQLGNHSYSDTSAVAGVKVSF